MKTYGYDTAGRTTSVASSAGTTTIAYDVEGRATSISGPGVSQTASYNGLDTRVSATTNSVSQTYLRDGAYVTDPVVKDSSAIYTPGISERRGSSYRFFHSGLKNMGAQGSTSQTISASKVYDAFGNLISSSETWLSPFGYAGAFGYQEDAAGLKLLGHRLYDASTGRFLTRDPIKDGRNWYGYCGNNPITTADPLGLIVKIIRGNGWKDAEWQEIIKEIRRIGGTKRGRELSRRNGEIIIHKGGGLPSLGAGTGRNRGVIYINPDTKQHDIETTAGLIKPTYIRILAHEMGHVIAGDKDDGTDNMNNVNRNENPIMRELNMPERTRY